MQIPRSSKPTRALAVVAVGIGVGLALLRAERERRGAAKREPPPRRASLWPGEPSAEGVRRIVLEQLELAIELLETDPRELDEEATVHELRKALKRARALLRLQRKLLGARRFARESATLRDCGARLSGARDAQVILDTLDTLVRRHPQQLAGKTGVTRLRAELLSERERAAGLGDPLLRRTVLDELQGVRARMLAWQPRTHPDLLGASGHAGRAAQGPFEEGLKRLYRKGRRRRRRADRNPRIDNLHALRKSAKDLRYLAETFDRSEDQAGSRRDDRATKRVRAVARRADRLGELLGEDHDLALLAQTVRKRYKGKRGTRKTLLKLIARRRQRLRERALRDARRLYERKPGRFVRRLRGTL